MKILYDIVRSWLKNKDTINSTESILEWINNRNKNLKVNIRRSNLGNSQDWLFDSKKGTIHNKANSFFSIVGVEASTDGHLYQQPIICQNEIGYLGIICKEFDGVLYFLMQAKIEPGNVNKIQISPTIQATKSNFTQKHGGNKPAYLDFFVNVQKHEIIVDQIQSEQSSRFYKKRNRNIVIKVNEDVEVLPSHKWMTLGQVKKLMYFDNLVNMDTRTVLSCLPFSLGSYTEQNKKDIATLFTDKALSSSICKGYDLHRLNVLKMALNDYKMFNDDYLKLISLSELKDWLFKNDEIICKEPFPFKVIFCDIEIEGREVKQWSQPLFAANGKALFGLFTCVSDGKREFLVKIKPEIGCFDKAEFGPSVQEEAVSILPKDHVECLFEQKLHDKVGIVFDTILSEEGGRFYHEENRNVIIEIEKKEIELTNRYFWADFMTLNYLIQFNNFANIQLRNLLSVLEA